MLHSVREPHVVKIKHILQTCALYSRQHNSWCLAVLFYELNPSILLADGHPPQPCKTDQAAQQCPQSLSSLTEAQTRFPLQKVTLLFQWNISHQPRRSPFSEEESWIHNVGKQSDNVQALYQNLSTILENLTWIYFQPIINYIWSLPVLNSFHPPQFLLCPV